MGNAGTDGIDTLPVGPEMSAYRMDMRFLILSSTRDFRASLPGLLNLAAGLAALGRDTEAFRVRRDSIAATLGRLSYVASYLVGETDGILPNFVI